MTHAVGHYEQTDALKGLAGVEASFIRSEIRQPLVDKDQVLAEQHLIQSISLQLCQRVNGHQRQRAERAAFLSGTENFPLTSHSVSFQ